MMSGGKDILNVWEKSCVSGSLESVCMEMGSFRVEVSGEKKFTLFSLYVFSPYFFSFLPFVLLLLLFLFMVMCICLYHF